MPQRGACGPRTLASTDPATLVPIFRQVHIRDRVAQTVVSESAFNDATGAVITFGVLALATGTGEFSLTASLFDLLRQSVIGIGAGAALGYFAALLIAHERWAFLVEYAPVVTLVASVLAVLDPTLAAELGLSGRAQTHAACPRSAGHRGHHMSLTSGAASGAAAMLQMRQCNHGGSH